LAVLITTNHEFYLEWGAGFLLFFPSDKPAVGKGSVRIREGEMMTVHNCFKTVLMTTVGLILVALSGASCYAQTKLEGIIKGRNGAQIILQTKDSSPVTVLLTDDTDVAQVKGVLKIRKSQMSMAVLIPGLPIQVEGAYDAQNQLVAAKIRFKGNDLRQAQAIQAGLAETKQKVGENTAELETHSAELDKHRAEIAAANARFGQLNDYNILDEVVVYFGNGKVKVDRQYYSPLVTLAEKSKGIKGYLIEVKGYASASGSVELNQKLSEQRAQNVTNILLQQGHVPLTNILAPGAMGTSQQIENGRAVDSEAANRRVVVRILQNKGIGGE
jgi:OmpA-OmpF porin, OOP family